MRLPIQIPPVLPSLLPRKPQVAWDPADACWRIGFWHTAEMRDGQKTRVFDPVLWLRFYSAEAAHAHIATRGGW